MIGNKLEQSIIRVFQDDLSSMYSINEISKRLKKSYPNINKKSHFFIKEGVLKTVSIGNSHQCFLNLDSEKTKIFLAVNMLNAKEEACQEFPALRAYSDGLTKIFLEQPAARELCSTVAFFKSSSKDTKIHVSDIIYIVAKSIEMKVAIEHIFKKSELTSNHIPKQHTISMHIVSANELAALLKNTPANAGRMLVLHNVSAYLDILSTIKQDLILQGFMQKSGLSQKE